MVILCIVRAFVYDISTYIHIQLYYSGHIACLIYSYYFIVFPGFLLCSPSIAYVHDKMEKLLAFYQLEQDVVLTY